MRCMRCMRCRCLKTSWHAFVQSFTSLMDQSAMQLSGRGGCASWCASRESLGVNLDISDESKSCCEMPFS